MTFSFDAIANTILEALWRASWQGAFVILLALGIEFFWQRMPAAARSWMWRLVFVKLVLALLCTCTIPLPVLPGRGSVDRTAQRIVTESTELAANLQPTTTPELATTRAVASGRSLWTVCVFSLWAIGVLVLAGYLGHIGQAIGRKIDHARKTAIPDLTLQRVFTDLLPRFGLRCSPRLCISPNIDGPCVYGMNRPTVLIPKSWRETCSSEQLQIVMAHELAHLQRHDLWWNQGVVACRVALFFHPLVWLAAQRYLAAQELACDELALRRTGGSPVILARLLLKFVDKPAVTEWANAAAMVGASSTLRERIVAMNRNLFASASRTAVGLVVTAGVLLLVPFTLADQGSTGSPNDPPAKSRSNSTGTSASASASAAASGNDARTQSSANLQLGLPAPVNNENPQPAGSVSDRVKPLPPMNPSARINSKVTQTVASQNDGNGQGWTRVTEAEERGRKIKIEETNDEIRVTLFNTVTKKEVVTVAKTAEDLKKKSATAHGLYRKYVPNPENRSKASAAIGTSPSDSPRNEAYSQAPMPGFARGFAGGSAGGRASGSGNGRGNGFSSSNAQGAINGAADSGNSATDMLKKQLQDLKQQNPGQAAMIEKMLHELERQGSATR